jgi:ubiquinone/menaquinone biosynthesis C-methylase UbiE
MARARKPYRGLPMEGLIATWYARNTANDARGDRACARAVAAQLPNGGSVLEVAPGPGYLAIEIARLGDYHVNGLDISRSFVRIAAENARRARVAVDFSWGDAAHMPFAAASFDFVVCRAAFKNFSDPVGALNEIHRVLKPGGRASIFDLRKDATLEDIDAEVDRMGLSWVNRAMTKWTFRYILLKTAYTREALQQMVLASPFADFELQPDGIGFELRLTRETATPVSQGRLTA